MKRLIVVIIVVICISFLTGCGSGNLDYVKERGPEKWKEVGFEVVGYEGFQWVFWGFNSYGGAKVWWNLRRMLEGNNITYTGCLQRWGDEIHVYGPDAIDAIRPQ